MSSPRRLLAEAGLRPKKRFAQNFLQNASAARKIAQLALEDVAEPARILEIGAGTGELTLALLEEGAQVTAIEIDPELVALLRERN
ncbi:MAG TPA: rRNA adenine N-6-methyltransferase family protein, partial [Candidatus Nitrosotalea sp.]|nr:rRNA adenine N-6-methyltransferase family protein [Candidatus Nitrosotalea sp.]